MEQILGVYGAIFGVLYWAILRVYRANTKENMKANMESYLDQISGVFIHCICITIGSFYAVILVLCVKNCWECLCNDILHFWDDKYDDWKSIYIALWFEASKWQSNATQDNTYEYAVCHSTEILLHKYSYHFFTNKTNIMA